MKRAGILLVFAMSVSTWGQTPPGAQGRKVGDFANVPEAPPFTIIRCGTLIDVAGERVRKNISIVIVRGRI